MKRFFTRLWFQYQLSKGKLIYINASHAKVGKTSLLIDRSIKYDIPILVGNQAEIDNIKDRNEDVKVFGYAPNFTKHIYSGSFPNGVLIDESVDNDLVKHLKKAYPNAIKIQGGFRYES